MKIFAIRLKSGKVVIDPEAKTHYELAARKGIKPEDILDSGFVEDGDYIVGHSKYVH